MSRVYHLTISVESGPGLAGSSVKWQSMYWLGQGLIWGSTGTGFAVLVGRIQFFQAVGLQGFVSCCLSAKDHLQVPASHGQLTMAASFFKASKERECPSKWHCSLTVPDHMMVLVLFYCTEGSCKTLCTRAGASVRTGDGDYGAT